MSASFSCLCQAQYSLLCYSARSSCLTPVVCFQPLQTQGIRLSGRAQVAAQPTGALHWPAQHRLDSMHITYSNVRPMLDLHIIYSWQSRSTVGKHDNCLAWTCQEEGITSGMSRSAQGVDKKCRYLAGAESHRRSMSSLLKHLSRTSTHDCQIYLQVRQAHVTGSAPYASRCWSTIALDIL